MGGKLFLSTFLLIFLAELGDKTQLAVLALAAKERAPLTILAAAVLGFAAAALLAIIIGSIATKFVPVAVIEKIAAVAFIAIGVLMLFNKI